MSHGRSCEDGPEEELERLGGADHLHGADSRLRSSGSRACQGAGWEGRRRHLVAGVCGLWVIAAVVGLLATQGRSAGESTSARRPQADALTGGVQEKFGLDQQFQDRIVRETQGVFDGKAAQEKDAHVKQIVKGLEGQVVAKLEQDMKAQLEGAPLEYEPGKVGIMPKLFSQTCVRGSLAPDEHVLVFYHDDDGVDDIPNTAEEIARGFQSPNAAFVGNEHLKKLQITGVRMCLEESHAPDGHCKSICYDVVDGDFTYTGPGMPGGMASDWQKLVAALSGQIDTGIPDQGTFGNFVETMLRGSHCKSTDPSESPQYCWMCPSKYDGAAAGKVGQWGKETGNWHVWGYGMTLDRSSSGDELRWQEKECNDAPGPWDTFYIVAQVQQAPTSTPPALANPTTTTAAPTTAAPVSPTSLFCFQVMNVKNYELSIVRMQLSKGASIFGCDAWSVFSDEKTWLSPGPPVRIENTVLDIQVQAAAGTSTHFLNTDVFTTAWRMIQKEGKYKQHGWTVKVDPDAVFFAPRLRDHVRTLPYFPNGVYILNCLFNDGKYWFFGAVEVISKKAVETYFEGSDVCMRSLDRGELGEDTWLRKCLDMLHVSNTKDAGLLSDGYCNEAPSPCVSGKATFHPFKNPAAWLQCWREAQAAPVHRI